MPADPELVVLPDADGLAREVAARTLLALGAAQAVNARATIALTAGSIMEKVWAELAGSSAATTVDWSRVDVFWADERFVPAGSPDRNDGPAGELLLRKAPFSAATQYPMPASDGQFGHDLDAAAAGYEQLLANARQAGQTGPIPNFDLVLLGVGPDGHCASLFPHHPGVYETSASVIAVRNSPKPPPLRISLSFTGLNAAKNIWVVVSGAGKAEAVAQALGGANREDIPSAGARGQDSTLWLIDRDAAQNLPPDVVSSS